MHRTAGQQALKSGLFCSETSIPCHDQQGATLGCETDSEKDSFHDLKQKLTECEPRVQQPLVSHSDPTLASNFYIQSLGRREPKKPENKMKCASLFG